MHFLTVARAPWCSQVSNPNRPPCARIFLCSNCQREPRGHGWVTHGPTSRLGENTSSEAFHNGKCGPSHWTWPINYKQKHEHLAKALRRPRRTTGVYTGKWLWSRDEQGTCRPKQVISVNKTILEHSQAHCLQTVYGCNGRVRCGLQNLKYYLAPYRKCMPTQLYKHSVWARGLVQVKERLLFNPQHSELEEILVVF